MRAICKNAKDWIDNDARASLYDQVGLKSLTRLPSANWIFGQDPVSNSERRRKKMCPEKFPTWHTCPENDQPDIYPGPWYTTELSKEALGASYEIKGKYDAQNNLVERSGLMQVFPQ
jgi:hypothetical protein